MALWAAVGSGRVLGDWEPAGEGGSHRRTSTFAVRGGVGAGGGRADADRDKDRGRDKSRILPRKTLSGTEFDRAASRLSCAQNLEGGGWGEDYEAEHWLEDEDEDGGGGGAGAGRLSRRSSRLERRSTFKRNSAIGSRKRGPPPSGPALKRASSVAAEEMQRLELEGGTCFGYPSPTLDPDGRFRILWDLALGILILYSVISIPIRIGFDVAPEIPNSWQFIVDCLIDCTFAVDICLNFFTGYYAGKTLVRNKRDIARAYFRGWFSIDLITTVPIDLFVELAVGGGSDLRAIKMVRILRLLKLARLKKLGKVSQRVREKLNVNAAFAELASVLLGIVFFAHLLCCFWYFVGHLAYLDGDMSWVRNLDLGESSLTEKYTASLYWAVATMTAVGYGDVYAFTDNERIFAIFTEIVGAIVFGFLIGNISNLLDQMDKRASTCQRRMNVITMYCAVREIPDPLARRIRRHMDYYLNHTSVFPENTILEQLTPKLRHYCVLQSNKEARKKQAIFQRVPSGFVAEIAQRWMPCHVRPHTVLSREGEVGGDVFFVKTGTLNVVRLDGAQRKEAAVSLIAVVGPGGFVGEASALFQAARSATIVAASHAEIYCLGSSVLKDCALRYPEVLDKFEDPLEGSPSSCGTPIHEGSGADGERDGDGDGDGHGHGDRDGGGGEKRDRGGDGAEAEASPSGVHVAVPSPSFARGRPSKLRRKWGGDPAGSGPLELMRGAVGGGAAGLAGADEFFSVLSGGKAMGSGEVEGGGGEAQGKVRAKAPAKVKERVLIPTRRRKRGSGSLARKFGGEGLDVRDSVDTMASAEIYSPTLAAQTSTASGAARPPVYDSMGLTRSGSIPEGSVRFDMLSLEEVQEDDRSMALRGVLRCDGPVKSRWDILLTVAILYSVISVPYLLGFSIEPTGGLAVFDIIVDVFFILDILVNFRTAHYEETTRVLVTMSGAMAKRYCTSGWFFVDIISGVPFDKFAQAFGPSGGDSYTVRVLKLVRILRLGRLLKLMKVSSLNTLLEEELGMNPAVIGLGKLGLQVAYIAHLLACGWNAASQAKAGLCTSDYDCNWRVTELAGDGYQSGERGASSVYLASFYWCFTTMTTVGYGDIIPGTVAERAFAIFAMLVGVTVFGYIVGSMANIVRTLGEAETLFKSKMDEVKEYLKEQDIHGELETRVRAHYEKRLDERTVFDEDAILRQLPHFLRRQVLLHVYGGSWKDSPFFEHLEKADLESLLELCPIAVMLRHDVVSLEGEPADFAFLILFGSVRVLDETEQTFQAGDLVGAELVVDEKSAWGSDMVVTKKCILLQIHRASLLALQTTHPAAAKQLVQNLKKLTRLGREAAASANEGAPTLGRTSVRGP